jgi:ADP-heptose:LPS heptosyltransferase
VNTATIRLIDKWIGAAACAALSAVHALRRALRLVPDPMARPPRRILFLKLVEQGATVLAYGALTRAAGLVGRENVYFCCFEENRGIVDILDLLPPENVFTIRTGAFPVLVWDILRVVARARLARIDVTVDLEFFAKSSAVLGYLCGARRRIGMHRFTAEGPYRGNLLTHRVQYSPYVHTATTYAMLTESLLRDPDEVPLCKQLPEAYALEPPVFRPTPEERDEVAGLLDTALHGRPARIVLLNPNPSDSLFLRKWPADRFVTLARRLLDRHPDLAVVFIGTPGERATTEELCANIGSPRAATLAGKTTLRQLVVLFTLADALVTNDSGPAHFATATDIEIVAMYGPETPQLFGPLGRHTHVLHHPLACSPCLNVFNHRVSPCRDNACIQAISVAAVEEKLEQALAARRATA